MSTLEWIMFSANFAFIITNLYGWLLKRYYVPVTLKEHFKELYPVHRLVATLYLLQIFELPYLINIGEPTALFYVNGTAVMFFSAFTYVLVRGYFFFDSFSVRRLFVFMLPVILCWLALLLPVLGVVEFCAVYKNIMFCVVSVVSAGYIFFLIHFRNRIHRVINRIEEDEYSNESDFSLQFAKRVEWLPLSICALMYICFVVDHPVAKLVRDVFFIVTNVWFVIYTLNPHRTVRQDLTKEMGEVNFHLTEKKCKEIEERMMLLLAGEKLYLAEHFTMSDLAKHMGVNRNYLREVISRSGYETFYNMINTLRVAHACEILSENTSVKMEDVAVASGFSSGSAFSQVFKRIKGVTPKEFVHAE